MQVAFFYRKRFHWKWQNPPRLNNVTAGWKNSSIMRHGKADGWVKQAKRRMFRARFFVHGRLHPIRAMAQIA